MEEQQQAEQRGGNTQMKVGLAAIGLLVIAFIAFTLYNANTKSATDQNAPMTQEPTGQQQSQQPSPQTTTQATPFKDGTYAVVGNYMSPGGQEELGVTVTLANGLITDVIVEPKATRPMSKTRQADFAANYQPMVMGKNIADVQLSKVSGSSLSPKGFNDAIEKIKAEAQG